MYTMPSEIRDFWSCATHSAIHMMLRSSCSEHHRRASADQCSYAAAVLRFMQGCSSWEEIRQSKQCRCGITCSLSRMYA